MPPTDEDIAWFRSTFHPIPKPALPDDCIEYSLHIITSKIEASHDSEIRVRLREVQKYATELQRQWIKEYIWQRQGFSLEFKKDDGSSFLQGRTEYGDSVEDEWVIVWLLRELTEKFTDLWVKVTDSDGEFLLIEASGTLPAWLEPEVAENRVWINDGQLKIIKPANASRTSRRTEEKLSLPQARQIILNEPSRLMHSVSMEEEAFYRLRNYPSQIQENMHHAILTLPRKIAFLLKQKPAYIAPAVEAFYLRDPISLKPLQNKDHVDRLTFPPSDLVTVSVRFPRAAYAQVKSQGFPAPAAFKSMMPWRTDPHAYARAETGMKVTCGFEMLVSDPQHQDRPAVREMKMLLEDLETGDEVLPSDQDIQNWEMREDDEKWLDISFDDLEQELHGTTGSAKSGKSTGFGDKAAQDNLRRIVKQFEDFLNDDTTGPDGGGVLDEDSDDNDDDDGIDESDSDEDKEASFDEDEFTKMMREMMGMPPEVMREIMTGKLGPGARNESRNLTMQTADHDNTKTKERGQMGSDEDDEDMETIMKQMELELRRSGALDLEPSQSEAGPAQPTIKSSNALDDSETSGSSEDDNIDIDLAKNLLESFKSQAGMAGPSGNLMRLMGNGVPPNRDDGPSTGDSQSRQK